MAHKSEDQWVVSEQPKGPLGFYKLREPKELKTKKAKKHKK